MGITFVCDAAAGCTFVVWSGDVTPAEWYEHRQRLLADPAYRTVTKTLVDLSRASGLGEIDDTVIEQMAGVLRDEELGPYKAAVIPNSAWDKARKLERRVEGSGITVISFTDLLTACAWLGVDADTAQARIEALRTAASAR